MVSQALVGSTGFEESKRMVAAIADTGCEVVNMEVVFDPGVAKYNFFFVVVPAPLEGPVHVERIIERYRELISLSKGIIPAPKKGDKKEGDNGTV